jgi:tRNA A-37 threonylcarbamoyl transferase component Bud32
MHIHGGRNNKITGNRIDARGLRAALLNQANYHQPLRDMLGNIFDNNTIHVDKTASNLLEERQTRTTQMVRMTNNRIVDQAPSGKCPF